MPSSGSGTGTPVSSSDYCTATQVKAVMPNDPAFTGATYDTLLGTIITRACRLIDRECNQKPGGFQVSADSTRYFDGSGCPELWIGQLAAAPTSVSVAEGGVVDDSAGTGGTYTAWSASDYRLWPYAALDEGQPYLRLDIDLTSGSKAVWYGFPKGIKIVGKFGYSVSAPALIEQAAIIQTVRWFQRGKAAFRDTGSIVEMARLTYTSKLDPEVAEIISMYKRLAI